MNESWKKVKEIDGALIQVRQTTGGNTLHLQVYAETAGGNREYGWAEKFSVPPPVTDAIAVYDGTKFESLATESKIYFRGLITIQGYVDGVQLYCNAPSADWNTPDGFVLDLPAQRFSAFIAYIEKAGLLHNNEGEQRFVAPAQEEE